MRLHLFFFFLLASRSGSCQGPVLSPRLPTGPVPNARWRSSVCLCAVDWLMCWRGLVGAAAHSCISVSARLPPWVVPSLRCYSCSVMRLLRTDNLMEYFQNLRVFYMMDFDCFDGFFLRGCRRRETSAFNRNYSSRDSSRQRRNRNLSACLRAPPTCQAAAVI